MALLKGINKTVLILGLVSLLNDISSEIITPVLPLFIVSLGGTALVVGLISGFSDSLTAFFNIFSGYLSDRIRRRKPLVVAGYGISSLSKLLLAFSTAWQPVLGLRAADRAGKGIRTAPRDALIADTSGSTVRGKAFGIHRAMDSAGAIIGAVLAFVFLSVLGMGFSQAILIAALFGFAALVPLLFVKEPPTRAGKGSSFLFNFNAMPRSFYLFLLAVAVFSIGNFSYMFFILRSQSALGFDAAASVASVLLLYIWFNIIYSFFSVPAGILSDRVGRKKVVVAGYALFGLTCVGFAFSSSLTSFILLFALYGLFFALIEGNQRAMASEFVGEKFRGTAMGLFHSVTGITALPAGIIAGFLWQSISPATAFLYGAAMAFIASALFLLVGRFSGGVK